jgi:hypothetical protein
MKSYLFKRFIQVVCNGESSSKRETFSGVPRDAKWSTLLWDFDIGELPIAVSAMAELGCYADDMWLWYEVTDVNRDFLVDVINQDLDGLMKWSIDNKTTFEPSKTYMMSVTNKRVRLDLSGVEMDGMPVAQVQELKVTGFLFDSNLSRGPHIDMLCKKARKRVGALRNLSQYLDSENMKVIYIGFIRSILEYGSVLYMGAAHSHLAKLDTIQRTAEKIGGFLCESLAYRREAAAVSFALKLLDQDCRPGLNKFAPTIIQGHHVKHSYNTSSRLQGTQLKPLVLSKKPINYFTHSFLGSIHLIWSKLPQTLTTIGKTKKWRSITTRCKRHLKHRDLNLSN